MTTRPVVIDCDPGQDDAIALMLAVASPELKLLGITTSFGNVGLERTTRNALRILELLEVDIPVHPGLHRALLRSPIDAASYHGITGMDGSGLPDAKGVAAQRHAVDFIIETLLEHDDVTMVCMAPLTNLAMAIRREPKILRRCQRIVLMGGSTDNGNDSPAAEFNILADPHAAHIVFDSGVPITMIGLNVTHQLIATQVEIERFRALGNRSGEVTAKLLEFFKGVYVSRYGWAGPALHDPCTIAFLIRPELFQTKPYFVHVETHEGMNFGRTTADVWALSGQAVNADVAVGIEADAVFDLMIERFRVLP
jgi:purine nucleosidase